MHGKSTPLIASPGAGRRIVGPYVIEQIHAHVAAVAREKKIISGQR